MLSPSVQLFVKRVQEGDSSDYALDESSAAPVAKVCQALGGLPIDIEVAARSLAVASVEQMSQNSRQLLEFLGLGEMEPGDIRHWDSLMAVFQWSCDLLGSRDVAFMKALSVFDGGWNSEAAAGICEGAELQGHSVLWHLKRLVDHSLLFDID